jgi:glycosyltransferase involved in cell wall biosynthesis
LHAPVGSNLEACKRVRPDSLSHRLAAASADAAPRGAVSHDYARRLDLPGLSEVVREFAEANFVAISDHQRIPLPEANWTGTIHHGLPPSLFRPSYDQGSYLAFLGRLTAEKGPEDAIRIARAAGQPLRIAAKVPRAETAYLKKPYPTPG